MESNLQRKFLKYFPLQLSHRRNFSIGTMMSNAPAKSFLVAMAPRIPDPELQAVATAVASISDGRFWNFIPGIFAVRSVHSAEEISDAVRDCTQTEYLVLPIDPTFVSGVAPNEGWNSWFFDFFGDHLREVANGRGWIFEKMEADQKKYLAEK